MKQNEFVKRGEDPTFKLEPGDHFIPVMSIESFTDKFGEKFRVKVEHEGTHKNVTLTPAQARDLRSAGEKYNGYTGKLFWTAEVEYNKKNPKTGQVFGKGNRTAIRIGKNQGALSEPKKTAMEQVTEGPDNTKSILQFQQNVPKIPAELRKWADDIKANKESFMNAFVKEEYLHNKGLPREFMVWCQTPEACETEYFISIENISEREGKILAAFWAIIAELDL